ncbi:MAG: aldehyde dehydrogenase family protein [Nitrospira sp.]|jgi:aldehyde dehydrogenase (NAD+)|nr:aldehyde dehydrogenase family protein [Nitrospira sp.]MDI3464557.1 Aldehyde dehydrogenase [Nitrospira sp.]
MAQATDLHGQSVVSNPYDGFDRMPLNGQWRGGRSGRASEDRNPYSDDILVRIPLANEQDLNEAYQAAAGAQPQWAATLPGERAAILRRAADIMEARKEEIVSWLVKEAGSTRLKANVEWDSARAITLEAASAPYRVQGRILPSDIPGKENRVYRQPVGVVGVISPWNFPMHLSNRSLAPALAVGNAVVIKPASDTPVTGGLLLAKIFEEAGLPPGVLSVVVGPGSLIGDAFVLHPVPRVLSFTGSTPVGRHIAELAAKSPMLKKVALELGGNSPFIILDDADLDLAVNAAVFGKFLHQGQICMITNRLIVDGKIYDQFVERFSARVRTLKVGDPNSADTAIGPIINKSQFEGLMKHIENARSAGARQTAGGNPKGLLLPPHVFADVTPQMQIAQDEMFGPVVSVIKVTGEEEAIRVANDTEYGLSSAVFSGDVERGVRVALQVKAGMTHVNDQPVNDLPNCPFGGEKNSGLGRFGGDWIIEEFTTDHWVSVQHQPRQYPF